MTDKPGADLVIRYQETDKELARIHVSNLAERHVEKVMAGVLRNIRDELYVDDSEIIAAQNSAGE